MGSGDKDFVRKSERINHLVDLGVYGIILKWILKK
jgi:hypothetical protein